MDRELLIKLLCMEVDRLNGLYAEYGLQSISAVDIHKLISGEDQFALSTNIIENDLVANTSQYNKINSQLILEIINKLR